MIKVLKFYADWCGPCKTYAPVFDKVMSESNVEYENINVDKDTTGLAAKYKVRSIPLTVFINEDGTSTKELGSLSEEKLKQLIK
jgi:thioredoxin 1